MNYYIFLQKEHSNRMAILNHSLTASEVTLSNVGVTGGRLQFHSITLAPTKATW